MTNIDLVKLFITGMSTGIVIINIIICAVYCANERKTRKALSEAKKAASERSISDDIDKSCNKAVEEFCAAHNATYLKPACKEEKDMIANLTRPADFDLGQYRLNPKTQTWDRAPYAVGQTVWYINHYNTICSFVIARVKVSFYVGERAYVYYDQNGEDLFDDSIYCDYWQAEAALKERLRA